ncbi:MAG: MerR family transcriptional regulator [Anaerolineae bacterium]|jgi:DNA-binding transcriptional MerR regulator|nr:MerR family transcriptional regulator [Anaerolineae bacterium]
MATYTVKEISEAASISPRTVHYYDEIGLLSPASIGENGYRYYDEESLLQLQQILFYKSFGFQLKTIKQLVEQPDFDRLQALEDHKARLQREFERLDMLITTIDHTIEFLKGEREEMAKEEFFEGYDPAKQEAYEHEIREKYGDRLWKQSKQRYSSLSKAEQEAIQREGQEITQAILDDFDKGYDHPDVQVNIAKWHAYMQHFYDCSLDTFAGLGQMYVEDPRFKANYDAQREGFAEFMCQAMQYYVQKAYKK